MVTGRVSEEESAASVRSSLTLRVFSDPQIKAVRSARPRFGSWSDDPRIFSRIGRPLPMLGVLLSALSVWATPGVAAESPFHFTDVTSAAGIGFVHTIGDDKLDNIVESSGVGCALLDYDGDGWLDVYLVNGIYLEGVSDPRTPDKERLALASDRLYRNLRDGKFQDVTVAAGIEPGGYGMGALAVDYDNDGRCDLYVTNYGPNKLYRNVGDGRFSETAAALEGWPIRCSASGPRRWISTRTEIWISMSATIWSSIRPSRRRRLRFLVRTLIRASRIGCTATTETASRTSLPVPGWNKCRGEQWGSAVSTTTTTG